MTTQRTLVVALAVRREIAVGKCRFSSGMTSFLSMRLKHISMSAFAKLTADDRRCTGLPSSTHSSMPQKCALCSFNPSAFTIRATSGNCSVGPIGPQMPAGLSGVACFHASMYSSASAR